jgi:dephospho-CoA kinase
VITVGLTGGIGSGKSTVAARLAELGAVVVDADEIAREVLEPGTAGLAAVVDIFGPGVLDAEGGLDRGALAARVFADPAELDRLNALVHPLVARRTEEMLRLVPADAVVVHDIPLLVETARGGYDLVVVVDAPEGVREARLAARGMAPDDVGQRMARQASREERLAAADVVIDNGAGLAELGEQVDELWRELTERLR